LSIILETVCIFFRIFFINRYNPLNFFFFHIFASWQNEELLQYYCNNELKIQKYNFTQLKSLNCLSSLLLFVQDRSSVGELLCSFEVEGANMHSNNKNDGFGCIH
jgi:hypothetical protein